MHSDSFDYHRLIVGYHGCDQHTAEQVLLYGDTLHSSNNRYDWLGRGIYFWEYGPARALEFAQEQQQRGKLETPCVLGAYIHLGQCFDLTDVCNTRRLTDAYDQWLQMMNSQGTPLPENKKGTHSGEDILLRFRDCALLNWYMDWLDDRADGCYYQTVRGVFVEGEPVYDGACIYAKTHVQIAVRDSTCILGYFLPSPLSQKGDTHE